MITKPMLAVDMDESKLTFPYIAQPKIDGVRAIHLYGKPCISGRSLKLFGNKSLPLLFPHLEGVDGELTYGSITSPDLCRTTTSVVNTHNDDRYSSLIWNVFDYITPETANLGYMQRYELLKQLITTTPNHNVHIVPYQVVNSLEELTLYEDQCLAEGYEGVILRSPTALPKNGRTTVRENSYLRIKRFTQEDAIVLSLTEAMENNNEPTTNALGNTERSTHQENLTPKGMIGSLTCRDVKTSKTITVGPGELDHEERIYYWNNPTELVGKTISYKFFPKGVKDLPRFPTYVTIRDQSDLVEE
jgi:DNA ligase-1